MEQTTITRDRVCLRKHDGQQVCELELQRSVRHLEHGLRVEPDARLVREGSDSWLHSE